MADTGIKCPKCGHDNLTSSPDCTNCGISFEIYKQEKARAKHVRGNTRPQGKGEAGDQTDHLTGCPNCGQPTDLSSVDCLKCGIVFSKYFEIQERVLENDVEKLKVLHDQRDTHEKAVASRRKREEDEAAERLKQQQIERERDEALKKMQAKQARLEEKRRQQAEKEKQEALKKQQEDFERQQTAWKQQTEKEKLEVLGKQGEMLRKAEFTKKQEIERGIQEALKKQQEEHKRHQKALKLKVEKDGQDALKRQKETFEADDAEIKHQAGLKLKEVLGRQQEDLERNRQSEEVQTLMESFPAQPNVLDLLKNYEGQTIGVNHDDPTLVDPAVMFRVADDHFSILPPGSKRLHSYPFTAIASIVEETTGIPVGNADEKKTVYLVVKVFQT